VSALRVRALIGVNLAPHAARTLAPLHGSPPMNYRSLLVLLDHSAACAARLRLAMRLARERDCHLVGLAPTGLIDIPPDTRAA
jgi:hypothetical protein